MFLSLFHISLGSLKSIILKGNWSLMLFLIILYTLFTVIWSSLIFFNYSLGFFRWSQSPVKTRSYTSFFMSIDLVILDYISQMANLVNFSFLAWFLLELDNFSVMVGFLEVSSLGRNFWNIKCLQRVFLVLLSKKFLKDFYWYENFLK